MKQASPELIALLNSGQFEKADLYTLTLRGGQVLRFTNADKDLSWMGNDFPMGIIVDRGRIQDVMGLDTSTLELTLSVSSSDIVDQFTINGVPLIQFISRKGLDGANLKLEQAFMASWETPIVGTVIRFAGRLNSVPQVEGLSAQLTISSWALLLNANYPVEVYQEGCMWTVYNKGCGLDEEDFTYNLTTVSGSDRDTVVVATGGGANFQQGRIRFTSGANNGLSRTVKSSTSTTFEIIPPLPFAPTSGDTFKASYGCDLSHSTCKNRFNNLARNKSTPFVPVPETSL